MNAAHLHLMVNHIPVFALVFALAALAYAMRRKSGEFRFFATLLFVVAGVFAWIANLSGEGAEHLLEGLGGYSHDLIEQHEAAAEWAVRSATLVALFAAAMEWAARKAKHKAAKWLSWALLLFGLHGLTVYLTTAYLGGQISHPELRPAERKGE